MSVQLVALISMSCDSRGTTLRSAAGRTCSDLTGFQTLNESYLVPIFG
jgi:hypothetical protein